MLRPMTRAIALLFLLVLLAACSGGEIDPSEFRGTVLPTPIPVSDFTLIDDQGQSVNMSDYRGEIVLLYFGYTFCPDICPTTLAELAQVQRELDDQGESMQVAMITVDPERDTPQKLAEYVAHFHPDFAGLTGTKQEIDTAARDFGIYYARTEGSEATDYLVDHTARVFVVDPQGNYMLSFGYGTPVEDIIHDLRLLMRNM